MAIFRINKTKNYTIISNYHLRDKELSLKAKGLLTLMLTLPEEWEYSLNGLASLTKEGLKSIRSTIQELIDTGYIERKQERDENGHFNYIYDIYELPPHSRLGMTVKGSPLYNNKILKENKRIKKDNTSEWKIEWLKEYWEKETSTN